MAVELWVRLSAMAIIAVALVVSLLLSEVPRADGFIFWMGNTTACDTCDEPDTYSGRNVFCCLVQSKCCGPSTFDTENQ